MNIAIIGSRNFKNLSAVTVKVHEYTRTEYGKVTIISGGAVGVDQKAKWAAENFGLETAEILPDMSNGYSVGQYHIRNDAIIAQAEKVIAFWDGQSPGTGTVIQKCLRRRKDIEVIFDK